jgi:acyl carrier protein
MANREKIRGIVRGALAEAGDDDPFADSDSLFVSGRLSSLDIVNILVGLEETFGFEMHADEFDPMRFDTVDGIVELVDETGRA